MAAAAPTLILMPFANTGDVQVVPQTDPNAFVNFQSGYTPDYEINLASGNPAAKAVERPIQNWLFNLLTSNVQAWQQMGFPQWYNSMPGGYAQNAVVIRQNAAGLFVPYRSLVAANVADPLSAPTSWEYVQYPHEILANVAMPQGGPNGPNSAILTAGTDFNSVGTGSFEVGSDAIANACPNAPAVLGLKPLAGFLQSMEWTISGNTYGTQLYMDRTSQIFVRGMTNGSWANWRNLFAAPDVYVVGEIRMWSGTATAAAVTAAWGPGWHLADGTNNTVNLAERFVIGQSANFKVGTAGGNATITLSAAQMPSHTHPVNIFDNGHNHAISQSAHAHAVADPGHSHYVNDPGHAHSVADPGHNHYVNDPGHSHAIPYLGSVQAGADNGGAQSPVTTGYFSSRTQNSVNGSGTGVYLNASATGIGIYAAGTGVYLSAALTGVAIYGNTIPISNVASATGITASTSAVGNGAAIDIHPPYLALCFVQYTGA